MAAQSGGSSAVSYRDRLGVLPMYALPHHLLSSLMLSATRIRLPAWKNWQIRWFIRRYGVDMSIAQESAPDAFQEFNSFFTRALKPEARPLCTESSSLACPADGRISQAGTVRDGELLQVKGQSFSLQRLLGGDSELAQSFEGGPFTTIYLSPRDYHRVHMPTTGRLRQMIHVPGRLFSVNPRSARAIPGLFCRNERVVSIFDTELGTLAMVLVGAVFVGSIEQVWCGALPPARSGACRVTDFAPDQRPTLVKGAEMGRFNMGSTVIMALANSTLSWKPEMVADRPVVMGESMTQIGDARA